MIGDCASVKTAPQLTCSAPFSCTATVPPHAFVMRTAPCTAGVVGSHTKPFERVVTPSDSPAQPCPRTSDHTRVPLGRANESPSACSRGAVPFGGGGIASSAQAAAPSAHSRHV